MAESRFINVRNVLTNYNFDINEDVRDNVTCKICKKIMIDPYSGICGCHYCYLCIRDYIGEDLKHCPGDTEECAEEFLVMERNVLKNLGIRRNIFNMTIKCPNTSCFFRSNLENIGGHIRICTLTPIECPFQNFGCVNEGFREDTVKAHLDIDELKHAQMVVEAINHLKNDFNGLKQLLEAKEIEVNEMKKETENNKKQIEDLKENIRINDRSMREETENNKRQIEDVKEDSRRKEIMMKEEIDELKDEIRILKDNQERIESQSEVMKEKEMVMMNYEINELKIINEEINKKEFELIKSDFIKMKENLNEIFEVEILSVKNNMKKTEEEIKSIMMTKDLWLNIKEDIVWTIKDFIKKINNGVIIEYLSDSFYKDDYKLRVRAQIGYDIFGGCLCLSVCIMRGERDERVKWPMKHTITINIINQDSLKIHKCFTVNYDKCLDKSLFDKPKSNNNKYIYCGDILYRDIKDIQGIIKDDSLTVGCSLSSK